MKERGGETEKLPPTEENIKMIKLEELEKKQLENEKIKERFFHLLATLQIKINKAFDEYLDGDLKALINIDKARKELREWENVFNAYQFYLYDWTFETRTLLKMGLYD